jgi:hypothetical protein
LRYFIIFKKKSKSNNHSWAKIRPIRSPCTELSAFALPLVVGPGLHRDQQPQFYYPGERSQILRSKQVENRALTAKLINLLLTSHSQQGAVAGKATGYLGYLVYLGSIRIPCIPWIHLDTLYTLDPSGYLVCLPSKSLLERL